MKSVTFFSISVFLLSFSINAQTIKRFDFGVAFSGNYQTLNVKTSDWAAKGIDKKLKSINVKNEPGLELAILCQYNINKAMSLRALPAFSFQNSFIQYYFTDDSQYFRGFETVEANLPLHLTYTLSPVRRIAPSFIVGGFVSRSIRPLLNISRFWKYDAGLDVGMSLQIKTRKFIIAPELLYSMGLKNLNKLDNTIYSDAIQKLTRNRLIFRIVFYG